MAGGQGSRTEIGEGKGRREGGRGEDTAFRVPVAKFHLLSFESPPNRLLLVNQSIQRSDPLPSGNLHWHHLNTAPLGAVTVSFVSLT